MKHTPGPWKVVETENDYRIYSDCEEWLVGDVGTVEDAKLIAAAPLLLEALEDLHSAFRKIGTQQDYDTYSEELMDAEQAIQAATE